MWLHRGHIGDIVHNGLVVLADDLVDFSQPVCFQNFHWGIQVARFAATSSFRSRHFSLAPFVGVKVHAAKVTCGIVALVISLACLAGLAVGKKCFVG